MNALVKKSSPCSRNLKPILLKAYNLLYKLYGPRYWWPANSSFEIVVGAILTQNTNWHNVEKAITNLKREKLLRPLALHSLNSKRLAALIRPSGYYNIKAKRLKNFLDFLFLNYNGKLNRMKRTGLKTLRKEVLGINGIGPETADSILLYAFNKPVFVIDAYTRRIAECLNITRAGSKYDDLQALFMQNLPRNVRLFNEYHALLVAHSKAVCKTRPDCTGCILHKNQLTHNQMFTQALG